VQQGAIDSGWAAWLPLELLAALTALGSGAESRRELRRLLASPADAEREERWERFRLVAPSRVDVPLSAEGLTSERCSELLCELGLAAGEPPRPVSQPEAVETVLALDEDDRRELERIRMARDPGEEQTPLEALPSLETSFGAGVGRNDPCPCGSGLKFKRCHGR
jgi:hypothetical protein